MCKGEPSICALHFCCFSSRWISHACLFVAVTILCLLASIQKFNCNLVASKLVKYWNYNSRKVFSLFGNLFIRFLFSFRLFEIQLVKFNEENRGKFAKHNKNVPSFRWYRIFAFALSRKPILKSSKLLFDSESKGRKKMIFPVLDVSLWVSISTR